MPFTVPPDMRALGHPVGLKSWADARNFPRDRYFNLIDKCKVDLVPFSAEGSVDSTSIAYTIAAAIEAEQNLIDHVLKHHGDIATADAWSKYLLAAGYFVYQRYVREVENGEWTVGDGA